jgi:hypothetical protein
VSLWLPNYAKQSQFAGHSNERKLLFQQSIMKMNDFADAVKNKPNQTQFIASLPALSKVEVSNLPVVSLPALSKVEVSNLLQTNRPNFKIFLKNTYFLTWRILT